MRYLFALGAVSAQTIKSAFAGAVTDTSFQVLAWADSFITVTVRYGQDST